jgi:hypothetical protein
MRKIFLAVFVALVMLAAPAAALSESDAFLGWGVVRAVGLIDRHVLVQNREGFEIVFVDEDAAIRDTHGAAMTLKDVPVGSEVEYAGRYWEGMTFAFSLRVSSGSIVVSAR